MAAYWIAHVTVTEPEPYKIYADAASVAFKKFNARILARGGRYEQMEGNGRPRNVVIEFETLEDAIACYNSAECQAARKHRKNAGIADIVIVDGV